jgi:hypothetical protein
MTTANCRIEPPITDFTQAQSKRIECIALANLHFS